MSAKNSPNNIPGSLVRIPRPRSAADLLELDIDAARPTHIDAFVPDPLPPDIHYSAPLVTMLAQAMLALGRLDTKANDLANPMVLIRPLQNHEALASSKIEGTRADFDTLVVFQEDEVAPGSDSDVREVANYVKALQYALDQPDDRRLSVYFIRELHRLLLTGVRGSNLNPGDFRDRQVVIGRAGDRPEEASYVPPPPIEVQPLLNDLEQYIEIEDAIPSLIRIALIHYQFEAIHPFNDGNGRVGRLLISLLLKRWGLMKNPCLDLSAYVYRHRAEYIQALQRVSRLGDWDGWISFLVEGVERQAVNAFLRSERLLELRERYIDRLKGVVRAEQIEPLVDNLFINQRLSAKRLQTELGYATMTAHRTIEKLENMDIVVERTGQQRNRVYVAKEIISIMDTTS